MRHLRLLSTLLLAMMMAVGAKGVTRYDTITVGNAIYQCAFEVTNPTSLTPTVTPIGASLMYYDGTDQIVTVPSSVTDTVVITGKNLVTRILQFEVKAIGNSKAAGSTLTRGAFQGKTRLRTVNLPSTITLIDQSAFSGCTQLSNIRTAGNNTNGALPPSLIKIGTNAFYNCTSLTTISLPSSLTTLNSYAFRNCTNLATVSMYTTTTTVNATAFNGCKADLELTVQANGTNTTIPEGWLQNCTGIGKLVIGDGITEVIANAFSGCTNLTDVTMTTSVTLCEGVFDNPYSLTINASTATGATTAVYEELFEADTCLQSVTLGTGVTQIHQNAFLNCTNLQTVVFNEGLTTIATNAFRATAIKTIDIPSSVTTIANYAFYNTPMRSVTVHWTTAAAIPTIESTAFSAPASTQLHVPSGVESLYQAKDVWKDFLLETRTPVYLVEGTSDVAVTSIPVVGVSLDTKPSITVTTGAPAYFNINSGNGNWQRKNGDKWEDIDDETIFTPGTWRFDCQIRIDGTGGSTHYLETPFTAMVDGVTWTTGDPTVRNTFSYLWAESPEVTISPSADAPLTVASARTIMDMNEPGTYTTENYYVQGFVTRFNTVGRYDYFYIADEADGTDEIVVYGCKKGDNLLAEGDITVGDKVVICGKLRLYNSEYNIEQSQLVKRHIAINEANFPDQNFRVIMQPSWSGFDQDNDNYLSPEEVAAVTAMNLSEYGSYIRSLKGIEHFTKLQTLKCMFFKKMTSLDLSKNTKLDTLDCQQSALTSLDLRANTALTFVSCHTNALTSLLLPNSPTLNIVYCYSNNITDTNMAALVESLPTVANKYLYIINSNGTDGNVITKRQVQAATAKGWEVVDGQSNPVEGTDAPVINFADANVKAVCVANWDTNDDGELDTEEAAAVGHLGLPIEWGNASSLTPGETYFIRNAGTGQFLTGANQWGTQISLTDNAQPYLEVKVVSLPAADQAAHPDCYILQLDGSYLFGTRSITDYFLFRNTSDGFTDIGYVDASSTDINYGVLYFRIVKKSNGFYTIQSAPGMGDLNTAGDEYASADAAGGVVYFDRAASSTNTEWEFIPVTRPFLRNSNITSFDELQYFTGLRTIPKQGFEGCTALTSVTMPNTITELADRSFFGMSSLTNITVPEGVKAIHSQAFEYSTALTDVQLPSESLTRLGEYAFASTKALKSIDIPASVTSMQDAFKNYANDGYENRITDVTVHWTESNKIPTITETTFPNRATATLHVPEGTTSLYQAKDYWKEFGQVIAPGDGNSYNVEIGEVEITSDNYTEITSANFPALKSGTASFDPITKTLTLTDAVISVSGSDSGTGNRGLEFSAPSSMLVLKGTNRITSADGDAMGVYGNLSIEGPGQLILTAGGDCGIYMYKNNVDISLTITNCTVTVQGKYGIAGRNGSTENLYINNATVRATGAQGSICDLKTFSLTNCELSSPASAAWNSSQKAVCVGSTKVTSEVVITPSPTAPIIFADSHIKALLVAEAFAFDANHDGELSYEEAAAVTDPAVFHSAVRQDGYRDVTSFDEFQYFTGLTSLENSTFTWFTSLQSITLPSTLTTISNSAFSNCTALTHVTIPEGVTSIENYAFQGCSALTDVTIPEGVTNIGNYAFQKFTGHVSLPSTLQTIGSFSFDNATSATAHWQVPPSESGSAHPFGWNYLYNKTLYIPVGTLEAYRADTYWRGFLLKEYGNISFADANVKAVCVANWDADGDGELSVAEAEAVSDLGTAFRGNSQIETFNELKYFTGLTEIHSSAFLQCDYLRAVTLPNTVTSIGDRAFQRCLFTTIQLPDSIKTIGQFAFSDCSQLADVKLGYVVKTIGQYAFNNTPKLTSITIPTSVTSMDDAFRNESDANLGNLKAVTVGWTSADQIPAISASTFPNRANATLFVPLNYELVDNQWVQVSTEQLYRDKDVWKEFGYIDIPIYFQDEKVKAVCVAQWDTNRDGELSRSEAAAVTTIARAFKENTEIQFFNELQYFTGITNNMDYEAFDGSTNLRSITLPPNLTTLPNKAFRNCSSLTSISIPSGVKSINDNVFQNCTNLTTVSLPAALTRIGSFAFDNTGLRSIVIPEQVTEYGNSTFRNCANLTSVTVQRSEPTAITTDPFPTRASITLTVPAHASEAYRAADYWKDFFAIQEQDPEWLIYTDENGIKYQYDPGYSAQLYYFDKDWTEFQIPATITVDGETLPVTAMADGSVNSTSLKELYIPASVTKLKGATFGYINALTAIHFDSSTPPAVTSQAFVYWQMFVEQAQAEWHYQYDQWQMLHAQWVANGSEGTEPVEPAPFDEPTITLYVPAGSKSAYEAADVWKDFPIVEVEGDTDISQLDNVIYIEPTNAPIGGEISLSFKMKNSAPIVGYQFNIELPEGMSVVLDEENQPILAFNEERTSFSRHDLSASRQSDGSWLVLSGSSNVLTYKGNEGEIFTMRVRVADDMAVGDYPIILRDMKLQEADKTRYYEHSRIRSTISVSEYTMGDTNGDGVIDIADYVNVAKAILGDAPAGFNRIAADIDGSGIIDITDYVGVATLILNSNNVKAQQKKVVQDIPLGTLQEK